MKLLSFFKRYEFRRKLFHFVMGSCFVLLMNVNIDIVQHNLELILFILLIITLSLSMLTKHFRPNFILGPLSLFDKPNDMIKFPAKGAVFYLIGSLISVILFDRDIASASIIILAVGDPAAYFIGSHYGQKKLVINRGKLLEGTLAGTLIGTIAAQLFVPLPFAFFGAAFGMIAEAVEHKYIALDDNVAIPVVSGLTMALIRSLI